MRKNPLLNPEVNSKIGPTTASIIIVVVLIVGAVFVFYNQFKEDSEETRNSSESIRVEDINNGQTNANSIIDTENGDDARIETETLPNNDIESIEEALRSTDFTELESSLESIDDSTE